MALGVLRPLRVILNFPVNICFNYQLLVCSQSMPSLYHKTLDEVLNALTDVILDKNESLVNINSSKNSLIDGVEYLPNIKGLYNNSEKMYRGECNKSNSNCRKNYTEKSRKKGIRML